MAAAQGASVQAEIAVLVEGLSKLEELKANLAELRTKYQRVGSAGRGLEKSTAALASRFSRLSFQLGIMGFISGMVGRTIVNMLKMVWQVLMGVVEGFADWEKHIDDMITSAIGLFMGFTLTGEATEGFSQALALAQENILGWLSVGPEFQGILGEIKVAFDKFALTIASAVKDPLKSFADALLDLALDPQFQQSLSDAANTLISQVTPALLKFIEKLPELASALAPVIGPLIQFLAELAPIAPVLLAISVLLGALQPVLIGVSTFLQLLSLSAAAAGGILSGFAGIVAIASAAIGLLALGFAALTPGGQELIATIGAILSILGTLVATIGAVTGVLSPLFAWMAPLISAFSALFAIVGLLNGTLTEGEAAMLALTAAVGLAATAFLYLQGMMGPVGLAIAAISAAITALAWAYTSNFMGFKDWVDGLIAGLENLGKTFSDWVKGITDLLKPLADLLGGVLDFFKGLFAPKPPIEVPIVSAPAAEVGLGEFPMMQRGGYVRESGLAYLHRGEVVSPRGMATQEIEVYAPITLSIGTLTSEADMERVKEAVLAGLSEALLVRRRR